MGLMRECKFQAHIPTSDEYVKPMLDDLFFLPPFLFSPLSFLLTPGRKKGKLPEPGHYWALWAATRPLTLFPFSFPVRSIFVLFSA